ncbi:MAG: molecular chaperone DnaJ [Sedimenticola selenatireducens]|uniref:Molecular chaperone DnaJ n=2 Tax=Sedimenticola selenatireducens TaxID=191960 RepID=A0A2N6CUN2_9GAMM|nr:MAG: molecular chaperone DnaJ [Sedimenticola selenatireducens]
MISLLGYLPFIQRIYRQFKSGQAGPGPSAGQQSIVETRFLRMTLDHDTGEMNGNVLEGAFAGRSLNQLTLDQLLELLTECTREDEESAQLLRAYLGRVHGDEWQQSQADSQAAEVSGGMTHREAYEILGLEEGADEEEIRAAHRSLMQKLHPDRGGSTYLASKINRAKEVLLGKQ